MSEKDEQFKERWFTILWSFTALNAILTIISHLYFNPGLKTFVPVFRHLMLGVSLAIVFVFGYLLYRCSCKKPGTKLLTFSLVCTGISTIFMPIFFLSGWEPLYFQIPYFGAFFASSEAIGILWGYVCWRMRGINKKLKALQ